MENDYRAGCDRMITGLVSGISVTLSHIIEGHVWKRRAMILTFIPGKNSGSQCAIGSMRA